MSINGDLSVFQNIPVDLFHIIFKNLSLEIDIVALVCKIWKDRVDSEEFRETIRPTRLMGIKQLIAQNPNIIFEGKEHPLPRKFYKEYAEKGGLCFFNPGRVKLKMANGEYQLVVLNSLKAIASLFSNPNLKPRFTNDSLQQALELIRKEEGPHWVWEEANARGFTKTLAEQQEMAKEEDKALYPERYQAAEQNSVIMSSEDKSKVSKLKQIVIMSNINDHVLGKFMAEAILGECKVTWDLSSNEKNTVRFKDIIKIEDFQFPIIVGVASSGLHVDSAWDMASDSIGFICARKSFNI